MLNPIYSPASDRYENGMRYRRSGRSGVLLPEVSLGLWHNFGDVNPLSHSLAMAHYAFDHGITHFDLANNYGPSYGSAEETFGFIMKKSFKPYRDELFVSTKAGYDMWPGPYGNWGSRKSLMASLDQSLVRMGLDYVDVFYSHRYDPETPLEETMQALVDIVRQGTALYVGLARYPADKAEEAYRYLEARDVHCLLYQGRYNLFDRAPEEEGILGQARAYGVGFIAFSPLAQGLLTSRYLQGVPEDSRMAQGRFLKREVLTEAVLEKIKALDRVAAERGQTLAEMSLAWVLKDELVTSVIIGASSVAQLEDNLKALRKGVGSDRGHLPYAGRRTVSTGWRVSFRQNGAGAVMLTQRPVLKWRKVTVSACRKRREARRPYRLSPTMGVSNPSGWAACTRNWWVRPVKG